MSLNIDIPTLNNDSFNDRNIATFSIALTDLKSGFITNEAQLLIRPVDIRCDESGEHPNETGFALIRITRQELQEMLRELNADWADHIKYCGENQ